MNEMQGRGSNSALGSDGLELPGNDRKRALTTEPNDTKGLMTRATSPSRVLGEPFGRLIGTAD